MDAIASILLGLTASERWAAARRMSPRSVPQQWLVLLGVAVMLVLLVLLLAISFRRRQQNQGQWAEQFDLEALHRGLTTRERQILLAVARRSGSRRTSAIFDTAEAFERGVARLLADFAQTRTSQENTALQREVVRLREKLGFRGAEGGEAARVRPGSRDIPMGKSIELTGDKDHAAAPIRAEVLRSDDMELVVALPTPVASKVGDPWLARYYSGMTAWEFRTSTRGCAGTRLTLHPSDEIQFVNRRRFPRAAVRAPALLAHLPLLGSELAAAEEVSQGTESHETADPCPRGGGGPVFVESTVTELAGPGLRLETRLQVQVEDRVLVVAQLAQGRDGAPARRTLGALGRVKHCRNLARGIGIPDAIDRVWEGASEREIGALATQPLSIAVELIGLNDEEIDALASLTDELLSLVPDSDVNRAMGPQETPTFTTAAP